jgi:predicted nucleic acid-binding protein
MSERVFVDTSAYYALTDLQTPPHSHAILLAQKELQTDTR